MSQPTSGSGIAERLGLLTTAAQALLQNNPPPAVVAIPDLHIRNTHPNSLAPFEGLLADGQPRPVHLAVLRHWLSALVGIMSARRQGAAWFGDSLPARADVLFVSHFLNREQSTQTRDLYYGDLQEQLQGLGLRSVTALVNHSSFRWRDINSTWVAAPEPRVLLNRQLTRQDEVRFVHRLARARSTLARTNVANDVVSQSYLAQVRANAISAASRDALRIGQQVGALAGLLRPKMLVTTYEGHSWERLAFHEARRANPGIICAGYNHAILFPHARAMTQRIAPSYDPDLIFTCGSVTKDILSESLSMQGVPVEVLGSARFLRTTGDVKSTAPACCLVLPEGLKSECHVLVQAALEASRIAPNIAFRVRLHPLSNRKDLEDSLKGLQDHPANFSWSSGTTSLQQDFASARWALYRGSSAIIQAVQSGLRPYYFARRAEAFDLDPLKPLHGWRVRVETAAQLAGKLADDLSLPQTERSALQNEGVSFASSYFVPFRPNVVANYAKMNRGGCR